LAVATGAFGASTFPVFAAFTTAAFAIAVAGRFASERL
jgi:hypothetical protein